MTVQKSWRLDASRWTHLVWSPLNTPPCVWLFRNDCQLMEEWNVWCQGHDPKKKNNPLFSVIELSATYKLYEMSTNATNGSREHPWLIFVNSLIHTLWGRCRCRWMELRWVGWTDGEVNDYCSYYFPCAIQDEKISHVTGWKTAKHAQELNQWNEKSFKCCLVTVLLQCSCSCFALF